MFETKNKQVCRVLTSNQHQTYGENLLIRRGGRHIAEADAGHTRQCIIQRRDVTQTFGDAQILYDTRVQHERGSRIVSELRNPPVHDFLNRHLLVADGVPDAGKPVRDQHEETNEEQKDGGHVFQVVVQLTHHAAQTQ